MSPLLHKTHACSCFTTGKLKPLSTYFTTKPIASLFCNKFFFHLHVALETSVSIFWVFALLSCNKLLFTFLLSYKGKTWRETLSVYGAWCVNNPDLTICLQRSLFIFFHFVSHFSPTNQQLYFQYKQPCKISVQDSVRFHENTNFLYIKKWIFRKLLPTITVNENQIASTNIPAILIGTDLDRDTNFCYKASSILDFLFKTFRQNKSIDSTK